MEPIRVLHILHSMNRGGAENSIMNYYRHIDKNSVQFDFLLTEQSECMFEKEIIDLGGRVFRVPLLTVTHPFHYLSSARLFFKDHPEYRIVHSHTSSKSFFPLAMAKLEGVPVRICHSHNTKSESGWKGWVRDSLKLPLRRVANFHFACGKEAAVWLYGNKEFNTGKVKIVPNVIETNRFEYYEDRRVSMRRDLGIPESQIVLGCTARFSKQKNHSFLISLFASFHEIVPGSCLLLVGDGELKPVLESLVDSYGLKDSVRFAGVVKNVSDYLLVMDFFMMPSINEGLPLSLVEAQISGLRCFASDGVPKEADMTGLVSFISLDKGPGYWAGAVKEAIGYKRESHVQELTDAGYDAATSARKLECFYIDIYNSLHNEKN